MQKYFDILIWPVSSATLCAKLFLQNKKAVTYHGRYSYSYIVAYVLCTDTPNGVLICKRL